MKKYFIHSAYLNFKIQVDKNISNNFSWAQSREENINGNKIPIPSPKYLQNPRKLHVCWNLCGTINKGFSATNNVILFHQHKLHYFGEILVRIKLDIKQKAIKKILNKQQGYTSLAIWVGISVVRIE